MAMKMVIAEQKQDGVHAPATLFERFHKET